jgi:hypothetical protein
MDPRWTVLARRHWQAILAVAVFLVFALVHAVVFGPTLARYRRVERQAIEMGMPLGPTAAPAVAGARVAALIADNSLNATVAEEQGTSGTLTAGLLDDVTRLAVRSGLEILATEQGLVTQLPASVQVRAHLRLRGGYGDFERLLGAFSRSGTLVTVDRFTLQSRTAGSVEIEVWVSQIILKRAREGR